MTEKNVDLSMNELSDEELGAVSGGEGGVLIRACLYRCVSCHTFAKAPAGSRKIL